MLYFNYTLYETEKEASTCYSVKYLEVKTFTHKLVMKSDLIFTNINKLFISMLIKHKQSQSFMSLLNTPLKYTERWWKKEVN